MRTKRSTRRRTRNDTRKSNAAYARRAIRGRRTKGRAGRRLSASARRRLRGHAGARRPHIASGAGPMRAAAAYEAGRLAAAQHPVPPGADPIRWIGGCWSDLCRDRPLHADGAAYRQAADRFAAGYGSVSGHRTDDRVLLPTRRSVAAVVCIMNEEATVPLIGAQLARLSLDEIVFVVNGSSDGSFAAARACPGATVVHVPERLGHDVGRAIGAKQTRSDIVLFLDGDIPVAAERLVPFVAAVDRGIDVALNDISPYVGDLSQRDSVTIVKQFLNRAVRRPDLDANSLTAVPHALSRRAIDTIGCRTLMVPPLAQAKAIRAGLTVRAAASVDVIAPNRVRAHNDGEQSAVSRMIVGDHVEAMAALLREAGDRLGEPDTTRKRHLLSGGDAS
ncbi:glycosyltransferase family 2 protein [Paenibacillus flagellatus]|uniref:Glycosyl transferase family 2 n=1 Tax=Paenibacillus flagellatus TaxID=2211139 RepID=A0A2V5K0M2_9BACL|nr:glycosyltransferase [Paenibacillus flagellatus]PYI52102.1 glycosyl transferase family 2 [Paenibacillus flagellatus]